MRIEQLRTRLSAAMAQWYMPREVLIRSDGRVKYLVLSRNRQIAATAVAGSVALSLVIASTGWLIADIRLQQRTDDVTTARAAYVELLAEVSQYYDEFATLARNMEANETALLGLVKGKVSDGVDVDAIEAQLARSQLVRAEGLAGSAGLKEKLQLFESDLRSVVSRNEQLAANIALLQEQLAAAEADKRAIFKSRDELVDQLADAEAKLVEAEAQNAALDESIGGLESQLAAQRAANEEQLAATRAAEEERQALGTDLRQQVASLRTQLDAALDRGTSVDQRLADTQHRLEALRNQREVLVLARDQLSSEVGQLHSRIAAMELSQQTMVQRLAERTRSGADEVEKIVTMTGVDVDTLLRRVTIELSGLGGPFVPVSERPVAGPAQAMLASVAPLDLEMSRWEKLQVVLRSLPLNAPLDSYSVGSGFGTRKDPFNNKLAVHEGLDFSAPLNSTVLATAPGKVVFAGRKGSYGRLVEIDHGFGIRTRYAHLKSILVEVGQTVGYRDKIGKLGTSGRSTGPHVHYEILVDGKPYDPMNFLKAGRYVFKG
jgi:murein DD-endopeptidase MepM/ murein hydrolase activator NlpD